MEKILLGKTSLGVSRLGAGCWGTFRNLGMAGVWDGVKENEALYLAYNMGVNIFDPADVYGLGRSERLIGRLLSKLKREGIKREEIVIISKVSYFLVAHHHGYYPPHMKYQLE